ncbi:uncharacterized protein LOC118751681, partial [Rhagoletis pomonella]|uniref:uncharacterized protein LOC118751681 n=1 Tax=Rhagoletis pomonella TaxID=28610 RepID=UPI0017834EC1
MDAFIRQADAVAEFESDYNSMQPSEHSKHSLAFQKEELKALWEKVKGSYDELCASKELDSKDLTSIKKKYKSTYFSFLRCQAAMAELLEQTLFAKTEKESVYMSSRELNIHLPPCDTDIFKGDYLSWPSFRDMFTAIYILNKRLTPVEKLYHLRQKTQGEAKEIVQRCQLTNDGFQTAWKNLCDRYENKRILVNSQLRILFNLKAVESECGSSIKKLQRDINNCISALQCLQIDVSSWDAIFTYLCSTKLPEHILALWEQTIEKRTEVSKWEDMDNFLSSRFQTLETVKGIRESKPNKAPKPQNIHQSSEWTPKRLGAFQASVEKPTCKMCHSHEHRLKRCDKFHNLTPLKRLEFIKSIHSCLNCLSAGHTVTKCTSPFNCSTCHSRHHTLLHMQATQPKATALSAPTSPSYDIASTSEQAKRREAAKKNKTVNKVNSCHANSNKGVLLGTAWVNIHHNGVNYSARALIDSGSECSFITERLKRRINLPSKPLHAQVSGINNSISAQVKEACAIHLRSPTDPLININTTVLVLQQLTGDLPTCQVSAMTRQAFPDLMLADKRFFVNEPVDLVLGGDVYPQIILGGLKKNILNTLLAQETVFGWIVTGKAESSNTTNKRVSFFNEVTVDKQLTAFWELEDIPKKRSMNADDIYFERLFKATTKRNDGGKYIVSLPFRQDFPNNVCLGPSLKSACSQFYRSETRLAKKPVLQREYNRVLCEYETLGHMSKISTTVSPESTDCYFLPHHAVLKEESTTTKVRVVFNASCPTAN